MSNGAILKLGRRYYSARFYDKGGRGGESKSWGKKGIVSGGEDNAEQVEDNDPLCWDDVDDGGAEMGFVEKS